MVLQADTTIQNANKEATLLFVNIVNTGQLERFPEVVAPSSVDHDRAPLQKPGPQGFASYFSTMRSAFPDLHMEIDQLLADEDRVAFAYTLTGTQHGEFMGLYPSGKHIRVRGLQIGRFEQGLLVERWGSSDELGLLQQLGVELVQD
jgi:steroid delta-isomerase-like uncharacterized protein